MKYLIHKTLGPVLFNSNVSHHCMAEWLGGRDKVVSAGFYYCLPSTSRATGGSSTLGVEGNSSDASVIEASLKH